MTTHTVMSPGLAYDDCTAPVGDAFRTGPPDAECADLIIDAAVGAHAVTVTSDLGVESRLNALLLLISPQ
jgi:hypothetical protein